MTITEIVQAKYVLPGDIIDQKVVSVVDNQTSGSDYTCIYFENCGTVALQVSKSALVGVKRGADVAAINPPLVVDGGN
jgi:hypothetical protein